MSAPGTEGEVVVGVPAQTLHRAMIMLDTMACLTDDRRLQVRCEAVRDDLRTALAQSPEVRS